MDAREQIQQYVRDVATGANTYPMLERLTNFYLWVERGCCMIRDIRAELVPMRLREVQLRVLVRMMRQAAAGLPVRIVIGKSRKTGVSTEIQALFVFLSSLYPLQRAITITHTGKATIEIFGIAVRVAKHWGVRPPTEGIGGLRELFWTDIDSWYSSGTAGGTAVGAGGTPSALHLSEVAKWEKKKDETELNATTAVPDDPSTIIIYESTFVGRDLFWRRFDDARAGLTGYDAIFIAWWMDPTLSADPGEHFRRTKTEAHIAEIAAEDGIETTNEMLAWRRNKIALIGAALFRQEYPTTPEEAIQATKGLILPMMRKAIVTELPFAPYLIETGDRLGGIDFGYNDPTVIGSGWRYDQRIWMNQCWWGTETYASEQVDGLRERTTYYCDPASLNYRKELGKAANEAGVRVTLLKAPRKKDPGEDIATVELRMLIHAVDSGRLMWLDSPEMRLHTDRLLAETDTLSWDERTGRPHMAHSEETHHFDTIMMLKYLVMGALRPRVTPRLHSEPVAGRGRSFGRASDRHR